MMGCAKVTEASTRISLVHSEEGQPLCFNIGVLGTGLRGKGTSSVSNCQEADPWKPTLQETAAPGNITVT